MLSNQFFSINFDKNHSHFMATIKYLLQSKNENSPIYLRLSVGRGNTPKRKTGLSINFKDWSFTTDLPKQTSANNKNLTTDLLDLKKEIFKKVNDANSNGEEINGDWLQYHIDLHFERISENTQSDYLLDAIQELINNAGIRKNAAGGVGLSTSRINSYKTLKNIITKYQGRKRIKVKEVNVKFANELLSYLLEEKGYKKSYALKKIADIKTVCFNAELNGIEVSSQLKKIDSAKTKNEYVIYLNPQELKKIEETHLDSEALINARKWLILGCNIGQRGSDLLNINENNFIVRNSLRVIELRQQKTKKNVTIPVLKKTKEIIDNGLPYKISIQKFNDYLKVICEKAGINNKVKGSKICMVDENGEIITQDKNGKYIKKGLKRSIEGYYPKFELISSHVCRRSFATNLYGELPTVLIMQITAHSTEKMLLNYIGKDSLDYAQQIADYYTLQAQKEKRESNLSVIRKIAK